MSLKSEGEVKLFFALGAVSGALENDAQFVEA